MIAILFFQPSSPCPRKKVVFLQGNGVFTGILYMIITDVLLY